MKQKVRGFELRKEVVRQAAVQQLSHAAILKDLTALHDALTQTRQFMADLSQRLEKLETRLAWAQADADAVAADPDHVMDPL